MLWFSTALPHIITMQSKNLLNAYTRYCVELFSHFNPDDNDPSRCPMVTFEPRGRGGYAGSDAILEGWHIQGTRYTLEEFEHKLMEDRRLRIATGYNA